MWVLVTWLGGWLVVVFFCEFASLEFLESASITSPRKISEVVKNTGVLSADEPEKRNTLMGGSLVRKGNMLLANGWQGLHVRWIQTCRDLAETHATSNLRKPA